MQLNFVLTKVNAAVIDSAIKYRLYICYKKNISLDSNQNQKLFYIKWAFQILQINISHNTVKKCNRHPFKTRVDLHWAANGLDHKAQHVTIFYGCNGRVNNTCNVYNK